MTRPEPDSPEARARAHAAADWLTRRDRGLTAAEQDEFLQWLAADPRHSAWYALHRHTVGDFGALAQWRPEHSEEPNPDLLAGPRRRKSSRVPILAAAAVIAIAAIGWQTARGTRERLPAGGGGYERRILEDGSSVEFNRGAVVTAAFSESERRVVLVRGEAFFTVTENPARPFIVRAGGLDVRAVGTAFSVRLAPAEVEVLVTHGKVALSSAEAKNPDAAPSSPNPDGRPHPASELLAGQRAIVSLASAAPPRIIAVTPEESARLLAWQPKLLDFSSAPLARAVEEFNRCNRVQFSIADAELAAMPIVASIRSDNVEGFARFLADAPGLLVERRSETEIVLRRRK